MLLDHEDDYRTGCRNFSYCQQQQTYSGLRSPGLSYSAYLLFDEDECISDSNDCGLNVASPADILRGASRVRGAGTVCGGGQKNNEDTTILAVLSLSRI